MMIKRLILSVIIISLLTLGNVWIPEEGPAWKTWPGAYAVFGFVACIGLIWGGKLLGTMGILRKGDDD